MKNPATGQETALAQITGLMNCHTRSRTISPVPAPNAIERTLVRHGGNVSLAAAVVADLAQIVGHAQRSVERGLENLAIGSNDIVDSSRSVGGWSAAAFERAARLLGAARAERQQQIEYRQTMLDTVAAALILLRNAAEAVSEAEHPQIAVSCRLREDHVVITIADNGHGLPANGRDQIFVPFFTTKRDGSGVGLSVARHIALAHRGQLEVKDNEPQGSVFSLELPGILETRSV
jgi:C4-dicarboxylate-specific signal transduction histidine kinase